MGSDDEREKPASKEDKEAPKEGSPVRERERSKDRKERRRSRSRDRSKDRHRRRERSRSRGSRHRRRSRSSDRYRSRRSRSRDRSKSRDRSRSRDRRKDDRRRDEKKTSPPPAASAPAAAADPYAALRQPAALSAAAAEVQRLWQEQQLRARQMILQQQIMSAAPTVSKTQREVHIGNLVAGAVSDAMLRQIFNSALSVRFPGTNVPGLEPVLKVNVHKDGRYAFVEFRTPEMADAAMDLNGQVQFLGQAMSVNRPSSYVNPAKAAMGAAAAVNPMMMMNPGIPGMAMAGMAGIPGMAGVPGLMPGVPGLPGAPAPLIPGLPGVMPGVAPAAAVPGPAPPPGLPPPPQGALPPPPAGGVPPAAVCVNGMVGADVLMSDLEYSEVIDDLKQECERVAGAGTVVLIKVPRPEQPELVPQLMNTGNYGKAFVFFSDAGAAQRAVAALHGRLFAGKKIEATQTVVDPNSV